LQNQVDKKQLRSFGLIVGGIFAAIGLWPLAIYFAEPRWWALIAAAVLAVPAVVYPPVLFWPHKGWMYIGHVLAWINTRIILGFIFYGVITPIGVIRRMLGKDPMGRRPSPESKTYRVPRQPRHPSHLRRQY
jgi:hypothetical protein